MLPLILTVPPVIFSLVRTGSIRGTSQGLGFKRV